MSFNVTNCISKSLSLTDVNITFSGKIEEKILRKLKTLVFEAKLLLPHKCLSLKIGNFIT
ncbi:MAG: hypothetical protein Q4E50_06715 [Tissierellia bacterium]|nr:hypothetical protein [Tissierellia bacterium]MDO5027505.1 hypothetical protein [Tissierellia bacterium]